MRKFFVVVAVALLGGLSANAQSTQSQQNCCDWWDYVYLNVDIDPILCIKLDGSDDGWVYYDCPDDFTEYKTFKKGSGSPNFKFDVWSNMTFDVSAHRHGDFSGPGPNMIPGSAAQVALVAKNNIGGTGPTLGTYADVPYYNPAAAANGAPENIVVEAPPTAGDFTLNFRIKPLTNGWQYAPGNHQLNVHVTITHD